MTLRICVFTYVRRALQQCKTCTADREQKCRSHGNWTNCSRLHCANLQVLHSTGQAGSGSGVILLRPLANSYWTLLDPCETWTSGRGGGGGGDGNGCKMVTIYSQTSRQVLHRPKLDLQ